MFTGENVICISSIDWDFVWQGHQEIMSAFARAGNRVLFIENTGIRTPTLRDMPRLKKRLLNWKKGVGGIRKEGENLFVYSPIVLPFPYSTPVKLINRVLFVHNIRKWMSAADFASPIIWTFLPTNITLDLIDNIDNKKLVVYYCIAEFTQLVKSSNKVEKSEKELLKRCDLVFAQGVKIKERCLKHNNNVEIFPFGVNNEVFENKLTKSGKPADMKDIKRPILGYIGGIHKHLNVELLKGIASKHPEWSIVLVGPMQIESEIFNEHKNIFLLGKKEFTKLPSYVSNFDVCLIPYRLTEYTKTVYPTKLNEYLIMGKPVVATSIPEIDRFNEEHRGVIEVAHDRNSFVQKIETVLGATENKKLEAERIRVARESNWPARIERMVFFMEEAIKKRHTEKSLKWREEMIMRYKRLKNRIIKVSLALVLLYLIAFKTSFLWFLASPLQAAQNPEKADVIIVFAGGVGESGRPGQGYEERVKKAAELYRMGYAKHMIFASGFRYTFQEADVMKALAISLGIPEDAILLEKHSGNTYDYAKSTGGIAEKNDWKKILLVSSPYNMRRSMLCFNSIYSDLEVIPTPIENSRYYARRKTVAIYQYKGIIHEYLGIVYYWLKGYIPLRK